MTIRRPTIQPAMVFVMLAVATAARGEVVTFQDLTVPQAGFFNGDPGNLDPGDEVSQSWQSVGVAFSNTYGIDADYAFPYWSGFAYSNVVDTTTAGFTNQYASYPGGGYQSTTYAVAYASGATVTLPTAANVAGFRIANTTYAYLAMQVGDQFSPALAAGGWFRVTATGHRSGSPIGSAELYLADLRGGSPPGIVAGWEWFDLSGLGTVDAISFGFSGSDVGTFGLNTPAYFAMDNLTFAAVPEPGPWVLLVGGPLAAAVVALQRGRR
ncbi:MAG: DUF4465 domain-containing protein [Planctomycetota bacterium]